MNILTLNTWGTYGPPERRPVLIEAIRALNADTVCLQEVTDPQLLEALGPFPTRLYAPEGGLAILSRFPASSHRIETYPTVSPLEPYRRQLLLAELNLGSWNLWIGTTHLAWKAEDEPTRMGQVEDLLQIVSPLRGAILLSGDFNAALHHPPIVRIREAGFVDLFEQAHPACLSGGAQGRQGEAGITWDNANPFIQSHTVRFPDRRIDYLFLRPGKPDFMELIGCEVVCRTPNREGLYPSDHYGVLAQVRLKDQ